jgi:hypothetical protein
MNGLMALQKYVSGGEVNAIYQDLFGRDADPGGLLYYSNLLKDAPLDQAYRTIAGGASGSDATRIGDVEARIAAAQAATQAATSREAAVAAVTNLYNQQLGRAPDAEGLNFYVDKLLAGESLDRITQEIDRSTEGYNYDLESLNARYRNQFGRNLDQEGLQYYMGIEDLANQGFQAGSALDQAVVAGAQGTDVAALEERPEEGYTQITSQALRADPYGGAFATVNPYLFSEEAAANVPTDVISTAPTGQRIVYTSPVTNPAAQSYFNPQGEFTFAPFESPVASMDQINSAIALARSSGALSAAGETKLRTDLSNAQTTDQYYAALSTPQAEVVLNTLGAQIGEDTALDRALAESTARNELAQAVSQTTGGLYPSTREVARVAEETGADFPFTPEALGEGVFSTMPTEESVRNSAAAILGAYTPPTVIPTGLRGLPAVQRADILSAADEALAQQQAGGLRRLAFSPLISQPVKPVLTQRLQTMGAPGQAFAVPATPEEARAAQMAYTGYGAQPTGLARIAAPAPTAAQARESFVIDTGRYGDVAGGAARAGGTDGAGTSSLSAFELTPEEKMTALVTPNAPGEEYLLPPIDYSGANLANLSTPNIGGMMPMGGNMVPEGPHSSPGEVGDAILDLLGIGGKKDEEAPPETPETEGKYAGGPVTGSPQYFEEGGKVEPMQKFGAEDLKSTFDISEYIDPDTGRFMINEYRRDVVFNPALQRAEESARAAMTPEMERLMMRDLMIRQGRTGREYGLPGITVGGPATSGIRPLNYYAEGGEAKGLGGIAAKGMAEEMRQQGRYGDTVLAHINPEEAQILSQISGPPSINPKTGLPEFFWKKLFKAASFVLPFIPGIGLGARVLASGLLAGASAPKGFSFKQGLIGGLTAFAGAKLAEGLQAAGSVSPAAATGPAQIDPFSGTQSFADIGVKAPTGLETSLQSTLTPVELPSGTMTRGVTLPGSGDVSLIPDYSGPAIEAAPGAPIDADKFANFMGPAPVTTQTPPPTSFLDRTTQGFKEMGQGVENIFSSDPNVRKAAMEAVPTYAAYGYALGAPAVAESMSAADKAAIAKAEEDERLKKMKQLYASTLGQVPVYGQTGGLIALAGGGAIDPVAFEGGGMTAPVNQPRMLSGGGDGMSDSIPATIDGTQPARLADGEFVIPADVVADIGNGSSSAGAKRLYGMMDRVREARHGTTKQPPEIKMNRLMPA